MFSALCLTLSAAILYFVLRYRVHIHVTYTKPAKKAPALDRTQGHQDTAHHSQPRRRPRAPNDHPEVAPITETVRARIRRLEDTRTVRRMAAKAEPTLNLESKARHNDLVSALKHQGCSPATARRATELAMSHQDPTLEAALRRAIEYARKAA